MQVVLLEYSLYFYVPALSITTNYNYGLSSYMRAICDLCVPKCIFVLFYFEGESLYVVQTTLPSHCYCPSFLNARLKICT